MNLYENLTMSKKERKQLKVFNKVKEEIITKVEAADELGITVRWVYKKYQRYLEAGDAGLTHKSRGKKSKKATNPDDIAFALEALRNEMTGFGAKLASETLKRRNGIAIDREVLRTAMIKDGIPTSRRKQAEHRQRRERRSMIGEMIQFDGSPHAWFEDRGPKCTLLVAIDDATSSLMHLVFAKSESVDSIMRATMDYIAKHGRPQSFYVDFGSVFSVNTNNPERDKKTQWERALAELEIEVLHARSPQAKGRVERANRTLQDRLVKELRLAGVSSMEDGNRFLQDGDFIARHNAQFAVPAVSKRNGHRTCDLYDLKNIFCVRETRVLCNDYTVSYNKRIFQIIKSPRVRVYPKERITVSECLDGSIGLSIRGKDLVCREIINNHVVPRPESPKDFALRKELELSNTSQKGGASFFCPDPKFLPQKGELFILPTT